MTFTTQKKRNMYHSTKSYITPTEEKQEPHIPRIHTNSCIHILDSSHTRKAEWLSQHRKKGICIIPPNHTLLRQKKNKKNHQDIYNTDYTKARDRRRHCTMVQIVTSQTETSPYLHSAIAHCLGQHTNSPLSKMYNKCPINTLSKIGRRA